MKIKKQTRNLAADSTWVRQGEADVVWRDFWRVLNAEKLSKQEGNAHGQETNS